MQSKIWKIGLVVLGVILAFYFYKYRQPKYIAGELAPDFTTKVATGKEVSLSDLRGNFVLLHFWGSWCGPCRKENPHLVELYNKYHDQGFEIFSIAIERNERPWQRAIRQDGLHWDYHTAELGRFNGPLAKQFNIHSIPTTYLINPEGRMMGVNLPFDQMEKMLRTGLANR